MLKVEEESLYPTLSRMQQRGWTKGKLGVSENNRQAKLYKMIALGRMHLRKEQKRWESMAIAGRVLIQGVFRAVQLSGYPIGSPAGGIEYGCNIGGLWIP